MSKLLFFVLAVATSGVRAQSFTEDTTLGARPTLKIESISPQGHCYEEQLTFFAPWAEHYEIWKRRTDTAWIRDNKSLATWSHQTLKPNVTGMIYKGLSEEGTFQFVVKAFKGNLYRVSDTIVRLPCVQLPK